MGWFHRCCTSTGCPMILPRSRRNSLCRRRLRHGLTATTALRGESRCPRSGCRARTCTRFWRKPQQKRPRKSTAKRLPARCSSRCHPPPPAGCAQPRGGSPSGRRAVWIPCRSRIWPTRWHDGARTGRYAPRWWPAACRNWSRVCARSPMVTPCMRPQWDKAIGDRCGYFPGRGRSGPQWALT